MHVGKLHKSARRQRDRGIFPSGVAPFGTGANRIKYFRLEDRKQNAVVWEVKLMYEMNSGLQLARAYIPSQVFTQRFSAMEGLSKGTIFPELYMPYHPRRY